MDGKFINFHGMSESHSNANAAIIAMVVADKNTEWTEKHQTQPLSQYLTICERQLFLTHKRNECVMAEKHAFYVILLLNRNIDIMIKHYNKKTRAVYMVWCNTNISSHIYRQTNIESKYKVAHRTNTTK